MNKNCPTCLNQHIHKYGKKNNVQHYFCTACNKTFALTKKLNSAFICENYISLKLTYQQLADSMFGQNNSKPYRKAPKKLLKPPLQQKVNIIANTTFFGLDFDVLVLWVQSLEKVIYHQIVNTKKALYDKIVAKSGI